jgi:hypothetical protein
MLVLIFTIINAITQRSSVKRSYRKGLDSSEARAEVQFRSRLRNLKDSSVWISIEKLSQVSKYLALELIAS